MAKKIPANTAGRNGQWGSTTDVSQKFTGQFRDTETGIDFFNARYFTGALGRFNSPDPMNAGADITNPQSWNAYGYVRGNSLNGVDPSGMSLCPTSNPDSIACVQNDPTPASGNPDFATSTLPYSFINDWISFFNYASSRLNGSSGSGGGAITTMSTPSNQQIQPKTGTLRQFWHCVASGTDYFSLQNGLRAVSSGKLGNGWLSGALLGNSVQSVGDTIEAVADFNLGKAANVAGAEAFGDTAGDLLTHAASKAPNIAVTVGGVVAASVATPSFSASASAVGNMTFNMSKIATSAAGFVAKPLALLGLVKLPIDISVAGFSAVACGVNF